jgi:hypothetical protein
MQFEINENYKSSDYSIWSKLVHTKYHFLQVDNFIKRIKRLKVKNYEELKMAHNYYEDQRIMNAVWFVYFLIELLNIKNNLFNLNRRRLFLNSAIRMIFVTKIYYLYFINTYEF